MKKRVRLMTLVDRPELKLLAGDVMTLDLEEDALEALYHDQTMGKVKILATPTVLTIELLPVMEEQLEKIMKHNEEQGGSQTPEETVKTLLYEALQRETERIDREKSHKQSVGKG